MITCSSLVWLVFRVERLIYLRCRLLLLLIGSFATGLPSGQPFFFFLIRSRSGLSLSLSQAKALGPFRRASFSVHPRCDGSSIFTIRGYWAFLPHPTTEHSLGGYYFLCHNSTRGGLFGSESPRGRFRGGGFSDRLIGQEVFDLPRE